MKVSDMVQSALNACIQAQKTDKDWCGYWRKPPEYVFTTAIARSLADLASGQKRRRYIELECDMSETVEEGAGEDPDSDQNRNKKIDIVVARDLPSGKSELWAALEVKNGWYGFKGAVLEKDLDRLCDLMEIPSISLKYALVILYVFSDSKRTASENARKSVKTKCKHRIEDMNSFVLERGLRFNYSKSEIFTDSEKNAWCFVAGRIYR